MCDFNKQMHLHSSSFVWNAAQTTSWSGLSDQIEMRLKCASESIYNQMHAPNTDIHPVSVHLR